MIPSEFTPPPLTMNTTTYNNHTASGSCYVRRKFDFRSISIGRLRLPVFHVIYTPTHAMVVATSYVIEKICGEIGSTTVTTMGIVALVIDAFDEVSTIAAEKGAKVISTVAKKYFFRSSNLDGVGFVEFRGDPISLVTK